MRAERFASGAGGNGYRAGSALARYRHASHGRGSRHHSRPSGIAATSRTLAVQSSAAMNDVTFELLVAGLSRYSLSNAGERSRTGRGIGREPTEGVHHMRNGSIIVFAYAALSVSPAMAQTQAPVALPSASRLAQDEAGTESWT